MADEVERVGRRRRRKRRTTNLRAESTYVPNLLTYARIAAIPFILYFIDNYSPVRSFAVTGLRSIATTEGLVISASDSGKQKTAFQLVGTLFLLIHFKYPLWGY